MKTLCSLTVRGLSPATKTRLAMRARRKGRSLAAKVRDILDAAAREQAPRPTDFPDWFLAMVEPGEDIADFIDSRRRPHDAAQT
jgi:plasmid stability protein